MLVQDWVCYMLVQHRRDFACLVLTHDVGLYVVVGYSNQMYRKLRSCIGSYMLCWFRYVAKDVLQGLWSATIRPMTINCCESSTLR